MRRAEQRRRVVGAVDVLGAEAQHRVDGGPVVTLVGPQARLAYEGASEERVVGDGLHLPASDECGAENAEDEEENQSPFLQLADRR